MHSEHADVETDPAQPPPSTSATAAGPAPRHGDTDEGWKKVGGKRNGKGEKRGAGFGSEVGAPSWADKARGRGGVSATVFIGGNRDATPQKARKRSRALTLRGRGEVGKGAGVSVRRERRLEPRSWGQRLRNYRCPPPPLPSWVPQVRGRTRRRFSNNFFCLSFVISWLSISSWERPGEGKGELATCRHRGDSGREKRIKCTPP